MKSEPGIKFIIALVALIVIPFFGDLVRYSQDLVRYPQTVIDDWNRPPIPAIATYTELHTGQSSTLVLFMHGLCGHPKETFAGWPKLMGDDRDSPEGYPPLSTHSIALLGYDPPSLSITIPAIVDKLRVEIEYRHISHVYDHIIVIAHSLGGVAMIDMLPIIKEQDPDLHSKLRAVFLIGTPAQGSPLANFVAAIASILPVNIACLSSAIDLRTVGMNAYLDSINRRWNSYMKSRDPSQLHVHCAYEGKAIAHLVVPVPKEHIPAHCDEPVWGFDGDHNRMVKPISRNEEMYVWVRRYLGKIVTDATAFNRSRAVDDIFALHTATAEVDDFLEYNIAVATKAVSGVLRCRHGAQLKPEVRTELRRRLSVFLRNSSKPLRTMIEKEFSDAEIQEIIKLERTQFTARRTLAALPPITSMLEGPTDDRSLYSIFMRVSTSGSLRSKYETVKELWRLARTEEIHSEVFKFIRSIPPGVLGTRPSQLEVDMAKLKKLAMGKQAAAFTQGELDRVTAFFKTAVGRKYTDVALRWIKELKYKETAESATANRRDLSEVKNYACN